MIAFTMLSLLALIAAYMLVDVVRCQVATRRYLNADACNDDLRALPALSLYDLTDCAQGLAPCCDDLVDLRVTTFLDAHHPLDTRCGLRRGPKGRFMPKARMAEIERSLRSLYAYTTRQTSEVCADEEHAKALTTTRLERLYSALGWVLDDGPAYDLAETMALSTLSDSGLDEWLASATAMQTVPWDTRPQA